MKFLCDGEIDIFYTVLHFYTNELLRIFKMYVQSETSIRLHFVYF